MTRRERIIASTGLVLGGALLAAAETITPGVGPGIAVVGIGVGVQPDDDPKGPRGPGDTDTDAAR